MTTKIDDFIKRVESTAEEDFFTPRTFYHLSSSTFHEMCELLKEQEAVEPKTIPEELIHKMWNALYAEENKLEKKYVGTKEHNSWFFIYRPWLQEGFNLAIKAIADWEGR